MSGEVFAAQRWDLLCKILATRLEAIEILQFR